MTNTAAMVAAFGRNGFAIPGITIPEDEFAPVKAACEHIIRDNAGKPDLIRQPSLPKRAGAPDEGSPWAWPLFELCLSPAILDPVEALLGPDILMFYTFMIAKPPGVGAEVPWHQDGHYSPHRPLNGLSVWIAIDETSPENGCLRFIPGSHRHGLIPHYKEERRNVSTNHNIDRQHFDPDSAVDACLKPGQFTLHGVFTIHGSNANTSGKRRAGYVIDYMAATSLYDRGIEAKGGTEERAAAAIARFPIWVVRGRNRHPLNDFVVGHEGLERYDEAAAAACRRAAKAQAEPVA
ncbi:MAG TPA: phytanoyl-CoA dioxygenase family protein [Stellaceae bacterium]|nr:phytanoyl-CoA dioxygenase family protein [Stellaceae bacterium]